MLRVEQVRKSRNALIIIPETDFETEWLRANYQNNCTPRAFIKTGVTALDVIGLQIDFETKKDS